VVDALCVGHQRVAERRLSDVAAEYPRLRLRDDLLDQRREVLDPSLARNDAINAAGELHPARVHAVHDLLRAPNDALHDPQQAAVALLQFRAATV